LLISAAETSVERLISGVGAAYQASERPSVRRCSSGTLGLGSRGRLHLSALADDRVWQRRRRRASTAAALV